MAHGAARWAGEDLPAARLEKLLAALVKGFQESGFQAELASLRALCTRSGKGREDELRCLRLLALRVQGPLLASYGLPGDEEGVELLKDMVRRRAAEGEVVVRSLGNEARALLGLAPMPDDSSSAEQELVGMAEATETCMLDWAGGRRSWKALAARCRARVVAERDSGSIPLESARVLHFLLEEHNKDYPVEAVLSLLNMAKVGLPASEYRRPSMPLELLRLERPSPEEFFEACVLPGRPAVLCGAWAGGAQLADPAQLRQLCGWRRVPLKSFGHADAMGRRVFSADPCLRMPLSDYLDSLEAHSSFGSSPPFYLGKVPLRREMPELADLVEGASDCPASTFARCFGELLPQGCFVYYGCGRNTTPIHFDAYENLLLCVAGGKSLLLFPPADARYLHPSGMGGLHWDVDFTNSPVPPFRAWEELPKALKAKFPLMRQARPLRVDLGPGDILYLPACWWHCVEGSLEPNMILTWWFELHPDKRRRAGFGAKPKP